MSFSVSARMMTKTCLCVSASRRDTKGSLSHRLLTACMRYAHKSTTSVSSRLTLNSLGKVEREEKMGDSACVWTRYVFQSSAVGHFLCNESAMQVKKAIDADPSIKLVFLCSPGNPTGTLISLASIRALLDYEPFKGIVVVDEAYIDFSEPGSSATSLV